jgi:DNA repair ATPase RecN
MNSEQRTANSERESKMNKQTIKDSQQLIDMAIHIKEEILGEINAALELFSSGQDDVGCKAKIYEATDRLKALSKISYDLHCHKHAMSDAHYAVQEAIFEKDNQTTSA